MPTTPTPENPRGYVLVPQNAPNYPLATNESIKEVSQDVDTSLESVNTRLDVLETAEAAITNANVDNSDAGAKLNAILAALRAKGIIES